jgi:parallel beta-helix repeat protein
MGWSGKMERAKIIAIGLVCILFGSIFSALATRTIKDTNDTFYTYIVCSNGNTYTATFANLRTAIWSYNNTKGGTVQLPAVFYAAATDLTINNNVTVIGAGSIGGRYDTRKGSCINLTGTASVIIDDGRLWNVKVNAESTWTGDYAVIIEGNGYLWHKQDILNNVNVETQHWRQGTGIRFEAIGTAVHSETITFCSFGAIGVKGFKLGIELYSENTVFAAFINSNTFESITVQDTTYGMNLTTTGDGVGGNHFLSYVQQPPANGTTISGITVNYRCNGNRFSNVFIWDWNNALGNSLSIHGNSTYIGGSVAYDADDTDNSNINVTGYGNELDLRSSEDHYYIIHPTGYKDGNVINRTINDFLSAFDHAVFMFTPGVYDIDVQINSGSNFNEFIFMEGAIFNVSTIFIGTQVMYLGENNTISGCGVINGNGICSRGIRIGGNNISISGMTINRCTAYGIYTGSAKNVYINDCLIENIAGSGIYFGCSNSTISNCDIYDCDSYAITLNGARSCKVLDNTFVGNGGTGDGLALSTPAKDNIIDDCTFYNMDDGVHINTGVSNTTFTNNYFNKIGSDGFTLSAGSVDTFIEQNHFISCTTTKIKASGGTFVARDNPGYTTENWGNTSVANNGTISHGLAAFPSGGVWVNIQNWNLTVVAYQYSATTFKVSIRNRITGAEVSGSYYVSWYAKV